MGQIDPFYPVGLFSQFGELFKYTMVIPSHSRTSIEDLQITMGGFLHARIQDWENQALAAQVIVLPVLSVAAAALGMSLLNADTPD